MVINSDRASQEHYLQDNLLRKLLEVPDDRTQTPELTRLSSICLPHLSSKFQRYGIWYQSYALGLIANISRKIALRPSELAVTMCLQHGPLI